MPTVGALTSLYGLLLHELRDLHSAEQQSTRMLRKMANAASDTELKRLFAAHASKTNEHIGRLQQVFRRLDTAPDGEHCDAMEGLIREINQIVSRRGEDAIKDVALITGARRMEHYQIAGYSAATSYASELSVRFARELLEQTLRDERTVDRKLNAIATGERLLGEIRHTAL